MTPVPDEGARGVCNHIWTDSISSYYCTHAKGHADPHVGKRIHVSALLQEHDQLTAELDEARRERDEAQATIRSGNDYMRALEKAEASERRALASFKSCFACSEHFESDTSIGCGDGGHNTYHYVAKEKS